VPVSDEEEAWASPENVALQDANGLSNPPAGMAIEKRIDDPDTVPEIDPRPLMPVPVSVMVTVPEIAVLDCVSCHVITPPPDESVAGPLQLPLTFTVVGCGEGSVGPSELPPPPQAIVNVSASAANAARPQSAR
jgi:hypothetical protein